MRVEHVDDLALLAAQFDNLNLSALFDEHLPDHGNWDGLSGGIVTCGWLLYILSESDHRLSHVQDWAKQRLNILGGLLGEANCRELDFSDDRLGRLLDRFSHDDNWRKFEHVLGKSFLEVHLLPPEKGREDIDIQIIRSDSFNAPQFREVGDLFKVGHTKRRRSDQVQCKVMTAALDPLALPLAVEIVSGNGPDYPHYLPVIERVGQMLPSNGHLYVGDSHMSSSGNRLAIHQGGNFYLSPLNAKQCSQQLLHDYLEQIPIPVDQLPSIDSPQVNTTPRARYYEVGHSMAVEGVEWTERRILCYSLEFASQQLVSFNEKLDKAEAKIKTLVISKCGRRNPKTLADLHGRIAAIEKSLQVKGYFTVITSQITETYFIKKYKDRPDRIAHRLKLHLEISRNMEVIEAQRKRIGWQVFASNVPTGRISAADLVRHYRNEYRIEHLFDYAINRDTGLLPLFLKKEGRVKGLIRLLMVAMRFSCSLQATARKNLAEQGAQLSGVYPGNKGRKTADPTTPMLLRAMRGISIVFLIVEGVSRVNLTELSSLQKTILNLTHSQGAYQRLLEVLNSTSQMRET